MYIEGIGYTYIYIRVYIEGIGYTHIYIYVHRRGHKNQRAKL